MNVKNIVAPEQTCVCLCVYIYVHIGLDTYTLKFNVGKFYCMVFVSL